MSTPGLVAAGPRFLVVNADDFGLTEGVNRGIARAHEEGIVTSASLMVRPAPARAAAAYARAHGSLSVGLHFDAGEWRFENGEWIPSYEVIDLRDHNQVRCEFGRQLEKFQELVRATPTHLDSHQHVHNREPARSVLNEFATGLGVPLRSCTPSITYRGDFYGQTAEGAAFPEGISHAGFRRLMDALPSGWSEVGCHPGYQDDLDSSYAAEREEELGVLCNPSVREELALRRVQIRSFKDYALNFSRPNRSAATLG